jgi:predicted acyltransferase
MKKRNESLDALRGLAILTMVLSGSIAFGGILPAWMYHAQVPPPYHNFHPEIPGITWVDLVFPLFLFSMGAAFPLALNKRIVQQEAWWKITWSILQRGLLLAFFAIFTMHIRTFVNADGDNLKWLLAIGAFILIHCMFVQWPAYVSKITALVIKIVAFIIAIFILSRLTFKDGSSFKFTRFDIIIIVLANMSVFGSAAWILTRGKPWYRILILPFIMGVFLSGAVEGSWVQNIFKWTPVPGLYSFYYLKYLFIIIPGTIAGEWLIQHMQSRKEGFVAGLPITESITVAVLALVLVLTNLVGLFGRYLVPNFLITLVTGIITIFLAKRITQKSKDNTYENFIKFGFYILMLGLVFEAYQGGIKKDSSTYSYYFVTTGLAFYVVCSLLLMENMNKLMKPIRYFAMNGKNPMVAYTAGNLILIPLLNITGSNHWLDSMDTTAYGGFLRGIIFTGIVSLVTVLFSHWRWYWKT